MKEFIYENVVFPSMFLILGAIAALSIVGNMDYTDEVREQVAYCDNVKSGTWPDYKGSYEVECDAEKLKEYQKILR